MVLAVGCVWEAGESKLTQLLRESTGSANCQAVSVVACISGDQERYQETLNTLQVASRLYRIKRTKKKAAPGSSGLHSGGESSCTSGDDRRRRMRKSASDPEATSSSEHSCDTVIYLGGPRNQTASDKGETTSDAETVVPFTVSMKSKTSVQPNLPRIVEGEGIRLAGVGSAPTTPRLDSINVGQIGGLFYSPQFRKPTQEPCPTWIDGPRATDNPGSKNPIWVDGPHSSTHDSCDLANYSIPKVYSDTKDKHTKQPKMDPFKREMIYKWVTLQEQENTKFIDQHPIALSKISTPMLTPSPLVDTVMSMDTSSEWSTASKDRPSKADEASGPVEMRDSAVQIDEAEIDFDLGRITEANHAMWTNPIDAEIRFLEDIQEENESDCHSASSLRSGRTSRLRKKPVESSGQQTTKFRNEAMATLDSINIPILQLSTNTTSTSSSCAGRAIIDLALTSLESMTATDSHPLSILSRDDPSAIGGYDFVHSLDTFSVTSEQLEAMSLPGTDQLTDEECPNDEDLEKAMQASMTSIRSHEILSRLKCEAQYQSLLEQQRMQNCPGLIQSCAGIGHGVNEQLDDGFDVKMDLLELKRRPGDGASDLQLAEEVMMEGQKSSVKDMLKRIQNPCPSKLVCCSQITSSLTDSNTSSDVVKSATGIPIPSTKSEKLQRPSIPVLPKEISMEITRELSSKVSYPHQSNTVSMRSNNTVSMRSNSSTGSCPISPQSLPRPTQLTSPGLSIPKPGWGRRDSNQTSTSSKGSKASKKEIAAKSKTMPVKCKESAPLPKTQSRSSGTEAKNATSSGGIIGFLRSPTRLSGRKNSVKLPVTTQSSPVTSSITAQKLNRAPGSRLSSGYDSGQDSGIGGTTTASESPELIQGFVSPYSKVTAPRRNNRTSSGHGSDNSSVTSQTHNKPLANNTQNTKTGRNNSSSSRLPTFGFLSTKKNKNRQSIAASSGYESASRSDTGAPADSGSEVDTSKTPITSPVSAKPSRKKYFTSAFCRSKSAPQSPSGHQKPGKAHDPLIVDSREENIRIQEQKNIKDRLNLVETLEESQRFWMKELREAKERLGVSRDRWSFDLYASECMDVQEPGFIEALQQETKILEKRVVACRNHIMMVTCFDSKPSIVTQI